MNSTPNEQSKAPLAQRHRLIAVSLGPDQERAIQPLRMEGVRSVFAAHEDGPRGSGVERGINALPIRAVAQAQRVRAEWPEGAVQERPRHEAWIEIDIGPGNDLRRKGDHRLPSCDAC